MTQDQPDDVIHVDTRSRKTEFCQNVFFALSLATSDLPSWLRGFRCNRALIEQTGADFAENHCPVVKCPM
jgi:hypothetical protein